MTNDSKPGEKEFFMITNGDIYRKLNDIDKYVTQLKHTFYMLSFIIIPTISAIVSITVNKTMGES